MHRKMHKSPPMRLSKSFQKDLVSIQQNYEEFDLKIFSPLGRHFQVFALRNLLSIFSALHVFGSSKRLLHSFIWLVFLADTVYSIFTEKVE